MVAVVSAVSIMAYAVSLIKLNNKWIQQQIVFLVIYLIGLTLIGELDILLPIYFVVSLAPFLRHIRKISVFTGMIFLYYGMYLIYGLVNQNAVGTLVTFIAKMWQFIVFFIVYDADIIIKKEPYKNIIWLAVITETLLGLYLMATSTNIDANGLVRLVSNAQPITGNISTVILPVSVLFYLKNRGDKKQTKWLLFVNMIMLVWIVLSGTRGYTLEFAATMILIFYDYFTNGKVGATTQRNRMITLVLLVMAVFFSIAAVPEMLEKFESVLRLNSSVGIRTYENAAVNEFVREASISNVFGGIGLGGQGGSYFAMKNALYSQFSLGMWNKNHYLYDSGALFHNLYANVIMCMGVMGIIVLVCINIEIWKRITNSCGKELWIRRIMHLFQLSFLLMNYYRWSAVCGIAEMIIFALTLKVLKSGNINND